MTREERSEALIAYLTKHSYRAAAHAAVLSCLPILLATGLSGAWEPPGAGLPFILAVLIPTALFAWIGIGFFLSRVTQGLTGGDQT